MSTVTVKIDMDDFYESFSSDSILKDMRQALAEDVQRALKRDPRWKALVEQQIQVALKGLMEG